MKGCMPTKWADGGRIILSFDLSSSFSRSFLSIQQLICVGNSFTHVKHHVYHHAIYHYGPASLRVGYNASAAVTVFPGICYLRIL